MDDDQRNLARNARRVQNLQILLVIGFLLGGLVGIIVGAYVIIPAVSGGLGYILAVVAVIGGAMIGQRVVLNILAR